MLGEEFLGPGELAAGFGVMAEALFASSMQSVQAGRIG